MHTYWSIELEKALEKLGKNKPICMVYLSGFYYLLKKELDFYPELVKHVKELARWDRMEHDAYADYDMYGETAIFLSDDVEKSMERLKEEFGEDYLVNIRFFLIKYLKDLKDLEDFMKTILFYDSTKWGGRFYMDLYFKDGTILMPRERERDDTEIDLNVELNFENSKPVNKAKRLHVHTDAIKNALKEGIFLDYIYRILKAVKEVERAIRETHKSFGGASIDVFVKSNGDVFVENVWDTAPMEITEKLVERVEEIVRNNTLALSDLLREKAVEHIRGLTL